MKKLFVAAAMLLAATASFGQAKSGFSASLGFNIEPYKYNMEDCTPSSLSGLFVRGDYEFAFTEHSGVSAGLRFDYIGLGDKASVKATTTSGLTYQVERTWKKAYLDIPVKYNLHFGGFYLNAGPVVKFLLSYKVTETAETNVEGIPNSTVTINYLKDYPDLCNKVYFGLGGGLGYAFRGGFKLYLDYDYIFTNVLAKEIAGNPTISRPSTITIGVGYNF